MRRTTSDEMGAIFSNFWCTFLLIKETYNRNTVLTKGAEYKFLDTLETSKKLFFSSSEGGNLVVRLRRISLLKKNNFLKLKNIFSPKPYIWCL